MSNFIQGVLANKAIILQVITGAVTLFSLIAKVTNSPKDDKIASKLKNFVRFVSMGSKFKDEK